MQFRTNLYSHAVNQITLQIQQRNTFNARGKRQMLTKHWDLSFEILADGVAAITTALALLETNYVSLLTSAALYDDDGNLTQHYLDGNASNCFGGIRVLSLDYPQGDAAEYVNGRKGSISLEADFLDLSNELLDLTETISYRGTGGPRFVLLEPINGPVVRQPVNEKTIRQVTQAGRAVGLTRYPNPSPPLYPAYEHVDQREIVEEKPIVLPNGSHTWPRSWSYVMEY